MGKCYLPYHEFDNSAIGNLTQSLAKVAGSVGIVVDTQEQEFSIQPIDFPNRAVDSLRVVKGMPYLQFLRREGLQRQTNCWDDRCAWHLVVAKTNLRFYPC